MTAAGLVRLDGVTDAPDLEAFLQRLVRFDASTLVRLRRDDTRPGYVVAHARPPFDVLVARALRADLGGERDVTVRAGDLAAALPALPSGGGLTLPRGFDEQWRGPLPPPTGWRRLETVPVGAVRGVVAAGVEAFRQARSRVSDPRRERAAADALLDQDALTVSDGGSSVVLPLRVLHAAWRMGFLGERDGDHCSVSVAGPWARLAAPFGSTYRDSAGLRLSVT